MTTPRRILVIKLSAFGDFIQSIGPMQAIRNHHPDAAITLLTTAPFVSIARESGLFNDIWTDTRPKIANPKGWWRLAQRLRGGRFDRVYDLQNNDRTALYFHMMTAARRQKTEWVGTAAGASHRDSISSKKNEHAIDRHTRMLALAGITGVMINDLGWVRGDTAHFGLPHPYIMLVPGSAPERPEKRWPAGHYGALAQQLAAWGYTPVVIGTAQEMEAGNTIRTACPTAINLCGQTSLMDLVVLARASAGAIGNDTGPMHIIAPTGCPSIILFSRHSDPALHAPRGPRVRVIARDELKDLGASEMTSQISPRDFRHKGAPGAA